MSDPIRPKTTGRRLLLALSIAPGLVPLALSVPALGNGNEAFALGALAVAVFTYGVSLLFGIPMLIVFFKLGWLRTRHFALGGAVLGLLPILILYSPWLQKSGFAIAAFYACIGAVSALAFRFIAFGLR